MEEGLEIAEDGTEGDTVLYCRICWKIYLAKSSSMLNMKEKEVFIP